MRRATASGHAVAAGTRLAAEVDEVRQQDDHDDRHQERCHDRQHQLLGRLDRAFVRTVVVGRIVVGVAHGILGSAAQMPAPRQKPMIIEAAAAGSAGRRRPAGPPALECCASRATVVKWISLGPPKASRKFDSCRSHQVGAFRPKPGARVAPPPVSDRRRSIHGPGPAHPGCRGPAPPAAGRGPAHARGCRRRARTAPGASSRSRSSGWRFRAASSVAHGLALAGVVQRHRVDIGEARVVGRQRAACGERLQRLGAAFWRASDRPSA